MPTFFKVLNPFSFGEVPEYLQSDRDLATFKSKYTLTNNAFTFIEKKLKAFDLEYLNAKTHAHKKNLKIAKEHFIDSITAYMEAIIGKKFLEGNLDFKSTVNTNNQGTYKIAAEEELQKIRKNYFSSSSYFPVSIDNMFNNEFYDKFGYHMSDAVIDAIAVISFLAIAGGIALFIATNIPATLILGFAAAMAFIVTAGYSSLATNHNKKTIEEAEYALFKEVDKVCEKISTDSQFDLTSEDPIELAIQAK
ncbi:MAG: hypothetical protein LCH30_03135 [Proteobacteria bacterium]|nr:hypothetical protein [Pseudomonadota bacterium]